MANKKWKKRKGTGDFWEPEEGEELVGELVAIREGNYKRDIYDIQTKDKIITVPSSSVLGGVITAEDQGKELRIKFLGWGQGKGGKYRKFEVYDVEEE